MSGPSLADIKTYLGITGTGDDALISSSLLSAVAQAETDTGRRFASSSNTNQVWSTDGQTLVRIYDVPRVDPSRTVTLSGVTLTENTNVWFLPDRRNGDISTTVQLFAFDRTGDWYKSDPMWWDKNLDTLFGRYGSMPLDFSLTGIRGHPFWRDDVTEQVKFLTAWFYWRAKSGASGVIQLPGGQEIDLGAEPLSSPQFVANWAVRTQVSSV
jgi:hypothetical protein